MQPLDLCVDESVELTPLGEVKSILPEDAFGEKLHSRRLNITMYKIVINMLHCMYTVGKW